MCDDDRRYYLTDANFNVTTLTDTAGAACERYQYSPYGRVTIYDATWTNTRSTSTHNTRHLYTGRRLDAETGLYYYRNRYYGATLGTFLSRDPIGYYGGINLFEYVGSGSTNRTDPSGLIEFGFGEPPYTTPPFGPIVFPPGSFPSPIDDWLGKASIDDPISP